ncbi:ferritin-like domain-containing protein [Hyalangium rubrum]|uniref:Ferritin-like domain-containing protein n=1 Tax=Hyalangium rubrum TaxID=3103134 RepID=A0ABU5GXI9_9BACT|nr:ferritin-like domain-containing protein [Hyalangium sp. s54d21]MDY7225908.1 ferritin-like domain-containing protein [Hyalangium sp. s54d21]
MKKTTSDVGLNRTGIQTSPIESKEAIQGALEGLPSSPGSELGIAEVRTEYAREGYGLGTVPVPATLKGMFTTAKEMLKGNKPTVFIDKLGERLGFERTGVRLYEAALSKFDLHGTWPGGPSREQLEKIMRDELSHFVLLREAMEKLGADPTALTPSADLAAVASKGIPAVLTDPRTNLVQCLEALMVAELTDNAGWELLIELAQGLGQTELVDQFEQALGAEAEHLLLVRRWLIAAVTGEAGVREEAGVPAP